MQNQLALLGSGKVNVANQTPKSVSPAVNQATEKSIDNAAKVEAKPASNDSQKSGEGPEDEKKNFGAMAKIKRKERVKTSELQLET